MLWARPSQDSQMWRWSIAAGVLQAFYTFFVVNILMWLSDRSDSLPMDPRFGSVFILLLLVASVGVSALLVFGLPIYYWSQRQPVVAVRLLATTIVVILACAMVAYAVGSILAR